MTKATRRKIVLGLWVCGRQMKEMADDLGVPKKVIEWDRQTLLRQHRAKDAPELIRRIWTPRSASKMGDGSLEIGFSNYELRPSNSEPPKV